MSITLLGGRLVRQTAPTLCLSLRLMVSLRCWLLIAVPNVNEKEMGVIYFTKMCNL